MQLRSFEISNYKNLKNVSVENISDLHTFIGKNSSGKSSIIEGIRLIEKANYPLPNSNEIVSGGIDEYDSKTISLNCEFEIEKNERKNYLIQFFQVESDQVDDLIANHDYLSKIKIFIQIQTYGEKHTNKQNEHVITIPEIQILVDGNYFKLVQPLPGGVQSRIRNFVGDQPATSSSRNFPQFINSKPAQDVSFPMAHQNRSFHGAIIQEIQQSLNYIQSIRESQKIVDVSTITSPQVGDKGSNLINLMDTMFTNEPEKYSEVETFCKQIFPDIENIRPNRRISDNKVRVMIKRKNLSRPVDLDNEGTGIDQLLIIIWKIATSKSGSIWFLDEPELHIHPGAQKLLYDFLRQETSRGKQILVATHSMVFMYKSSEKETTLALEQDGYSILISLEKLIATEKENREETRTEEIRKIIYEVLGYDPAMGFEPQKIVMVEGQADQEIFKIFAETLDTPINYRTTKFLIVGDKRDTKQFAPILSHAMSGKKSLIILDNDLDNPDDIKQSILAHEQNYINKLGMTSSILNDQNFSFYDEDVYSIEDFLLDHEAIARTGNITDQEEIDSIKLKIKDELDKPKENRIKSKELIQNIWEEHTATTYDQVDTAKKIASNITSRFLMKHPDLIEIIKKINSN